MEIAIEAKNPAPPTSAATTEVAWVGSGDCPKVFRMDSSLALTNFDLKFLKLTHTPREARPAT